MKGQEDITVITYFVNISGYMSLSGNEKYKPALQ